VGLLISNANRRPPGHWVHHILLMKLGITISDFTWPAGSARLGSTIADIARTADQAGFESLWVMDHFWQIRGIGPPEHEMLEGYSVLAYMAAVTSRVRLGTMVTGAVYRYPAVLAKTVTTLDVLSGGRAWLGIGAAWNEQESRGLGIPFPPIAERFERLEETLQICLAMWEGKRGSEKPLHGKHFQLERALNVPQSLSRPHPPILIGGMGEKKTLRLVAQYADASNFFPTPEVPRKLDILREHCKALGRNYDEIEKTAMFTLDVGDNGEKVDQLVNGLRWLAGMGIQTAIGSVPHVDRIKPLEIIGEKVIPAVASLAVASPA
jgi:F420-dependent oxidoreductase-like protein